MMTADLDKCRFRRIFFSPPLAKIANRALIGRPEQERDMTPIIQSEKTSLNFLR